MSMFGEFQRRLEMLLHRGRFQSELEEELRLHVDLRKKQQVEAGLTPEAAQRSAQLRFGNLTRVKEQSYIAWGWEWLETFVQDAGYGLRSMLRTPAITIVALISLALGIGANTAIFSFLDAVMLRSLPVKEPPQLFKLGPDDLGGITDLFACTELYSYPFYRQFQRENSVFSDTAAVFSMVNDVRGVIDNRQESEMIHVQTVSGTYFSTLGVGSQLGRVLDDQDDSSEGDHPVVVISDGFWKRSLGRDPAVLNHTLRLGDHVFQIVGVAPPEFFGTTVGVAPDAWAPLSMAGIIPPGWGAYHANFSESLYIIGRLKPGVTAQQATANVNVLFPQILRSFPDAKLTQDNQARLATAHVELTNMARGLSFLRGAYSEPLKILMAIVALVLLIACANIANLLLARSTVRARELAVRQALGARRSRLIRQLLTESLLLAIAGGALGIGLAALANRLLLRMITNGSGSVSLDVSLNLRLLAFTFTITVSTALLFGTLPAFRATRLHLTESLKSGRGGLSAASRTPVAKVLVVGQVALSLTLMVAACLFLRTLVNLNKVDTGFNKQNVLRLDIDDTNLGSQDNTALFKRIEERVSTLPTVQAASFSDFTFHQSGWMTGIRVPGMPVNTSLRNIKHNKVGDAYFKVMQIPLLAGRTFGPQDTPTSPRVAIISENMARHLFPPGSPIGRNYFIGSEGSSEPLQQVQVIGVARDVKFGDLGEPLNYIDYLSNSQGDGWFTDFEVRYTGDFGVVTREVQEAIHSVDRRLLISHVTTLEEQVALSYTNQTVIAELSAFFAVVAVFLSCIGLYGLMSYLVSRRTGEIGIRMALGAPRSGVAWQVLREIGLMVLAGIMIGLPVTLGVSRVVHNMLYGISGTDPLSLTIAVLLLLFAGLASGYVPARRASRVDPAVALRDE